MSNNKPSPPPAEPAPELVGPPSPFDAPIKTVQETATEFSQDAVIWITKSAQDAALAIIIALGTVLVLRFLRMAMLKLLTPKEGLSIRGFRSVVLRLTKRTSALFLTVFGCWAVVEWQIVVVPAGVKRGLDFALALMGAIQFALWLREIVAMYIDRRLARQGGAESSLSGAISVLNLLINLLVWSIALLMILDNLGVNVTTMVAGLGIGGLAIGLAAQGVISDLFSALSIIFDKPFVRGDFITFGTEMGSIERVGMKNTRIRALSGEQIVVSNNQLLSSTIHNYRRMEDRRVIFKFTVGVETSAESLLTIPQIIKDAVTAQDGTRFDRAHFMGLGERGFDFETVYYFRGRDYNPYMDANQAILIDIVKHCEQNGILLAFAPVQLPSWMQKPPPSPKAETV